MYWIRGRVSAFTAITTRPSIILVTVQLTDKSFNGTALKFIQEGVNLLEAYFLTTKALYTKIWDIGGTVFFKQILDIGTIYIGGLFQDAIVMNDVFYLAMGPYDAYYYCEDPLAEDPIWTESTLTDHIAYRFLTASNPTKTANILCKTDYPNIVTYTTDGRNIADGGSEWSSAVYVGLTGSSEVNIFTLNGNIAVGRAEGLYEYDTSGGVEKIINLNSDLSNTAFSSVINWKANTYYNTNWGLNELTNYYSLNKVGAMEIDAKIELKGQCTALTSDEDFIYEAVLSGSNTTIYKGFKVGDIWSWCPFIYNGANTCKSMMIYSDPLLNVKPKFLFFTYGSVLKSCNLSLTPSNDSNCDFAASGNLVTSYDYGTNPYWDKIFQSVIIETYNCAAGRTVTIKYRKDSETTFTALTSAIAKNGVQRINLSSQIACKRIQFEIDLVTNDSTKSPEIHMFTVSGVEKPESFRVHEATYYLGEDPSKKAKTIRDFLRSAKTETGLIKFADLRYKDITTTPTYSWVILQPGYPQEVEVVQEKGREPELGLKVRWQEINYPVT
jgi:hypothetical protein